MQYLQFPRPACAFSVYEKYSQFYEINSGSYYCSGFDKMEVLVKELKKYLFKYNILLFFFSFSKDAYAAILLQSLRFVLPLESCFII